ncbi:MAG: hypothetical protein KA270_20820 [Saprospiraceae bacterium]|jgi:hypothetical protein|nr:hypothetical protein [Saprospiraceae bacterium]
MKHLFTIVAIFATLQMFGQKKIVWFDTGIKVQYGAAGLYNAAISDSKAFDHEIGRGLSYGGKIGVNFNFGGFTLDVMKSSLNQGFEFKEDLTMSPKINWDALDFYLLYRNAKNLGYFEIGPKLSLIQKVTYDRVTEEQTENFNSNTLGGVVGFGANIMGNDGRFSGILGLRFEYAFTDFVKDNTNDSEYPLPFIYTDGYKPSNIAFAGVVFELNWGIGYFGKAQCGARSKFIMF